MYLIFVLYVLFTLFNIYFILFIFYQFYYIIGIDFARYIKLESCRHFLVLKFYNNINFSATT